MSASLFAYDILTIRRNPQPQRPITGE